MSHIVDSKVEARNLLKAFMQTENEAEQIKNKYNRLQKHQPEIHQVPKQHNNELEEDFDLALKLLREKQSQRLSKESNLTTSIKKPLANSKVVQAKNSVKVQSKERVNTDQKNQTRSSINSSFNSRNSSNNKDIMELKERRAKLEKESEILQKEFSNMKAMIQNEQKENSHHSDNLIKQFDKNKDKLKEMERMADEAKRNYNHFKMEKFGQKLQRVFKRKQQNYGRELVQILVKFHTETSEKEKKISRFFNLRWKTRIFLELLKNCQQSKQDKDMKQMLDQRLKYESKNKTAMEFRFTKLQMKFFSQWKLHQKSSQYSKILQTQQNQMKDKVDTFLSEMKQNIQRDMFTFQHQNEKITKSIQVSQINENQLSEMQNKDLINDSQKSIPFPQLLVVQQIEPEHFEMMQDDNKSQFLTDLINDSKQQQNKIVFIDQDCRSQQFQTPKEESYLINEQQLDNTQQIPVNPWKQQPSVVDKSQDEISRRGSKLINTQKNQKLLELEQKAQHRKEVNDILKKKHEEKRKQKELEKQLQDQEKQLEEQHRREEEYKQYQLKKRKEKEARELQIQQEQSFQIKMDLAKKHYEQALKRYQIFLPLVNNLMISNYKYEIAARTQNFKSLRQAFVVFKEHHQLIQQELEYEMNLKESIAQNHYNLTVKLKIFTQFKLLYKETQSSKKRALEIRQDYLKRNLFSLWFGVLSNLREENIQIEKDQTNIIEGFRRENLQTKCFNVWRQCSQTEKQERQKAEHKMKMWNKVNYWLQEFDAKKDQIEEQQP